MPVSASSPPVPAIRVRDVNDGPVRRQGAFVLYWMIASRRTRSNFALDRALALARELEKPLVILEALRSDYRWASDRMHRFVIEGMVDNERALEGTPVLYHPYVEPARGAGRGLIAALAEHACCVVTDDAPMFFLGNMVSAAGKRLTVRLEAVDSNGLLPLRAADRSFARAYDFRRFLQRNLGPHLEQRPANTPPLDSLAPAPELPGEIQQRWPRADLVALTQGGGLSQLEIDHDVAPVQYRGGAETAHAELARFARERLAQYGDDRNHPEANGASGLSPYLHFGHVSSHEVLDAVAEQERWNTDRITDLRSGKREGWWGLPPAVEGFLDQIATWRELGFNMAQFLAEYESFETLPAWARETLAEHAGDPRAHVYSLEEFDLAQTHDELWNAAQNQLRADGRIHNYLRMLWGKKILHWSRSPEAAHEIMVELNNRYAVDGRDPNSYSGIGWTLGRFDRAWGPEREIFGKIRYMSSDNTRRKLKVKAYVERWTTGQHSLGLG